VRRGRPANHLASSTMDDMRDPMIPMPEPVLSDTERQRALAMFCFFCFFTAVSAQTYIATQPLLITEALNQDVIMAGVVQTVMVVGSVVSYAALNPLLKRVSPLRLAIVSQILRIISAAVYAVFVGKIRLGSWTLPVVIASRFLFGLSMGAAGMPAIWIGHRYQKKERPKAIAKFSAALGCGMVLGPVFGSLLSTASPDLLTECAMPGWFSVGVSALLILMMATRFPDRQMLPDLQSKGDEEGEGGEEYGPARRTCIMIISVTFIALFGLMALEGTAPIIIEKCASPAPRQTSCVRRARTVRQRCGVALPTDHFTTTAPPRRAYKWEANDQYRFFIPVGVANLLAGIVMIELQERAQSCSCIPTCHRTCAISAPAPQPTGCGDGCAHAAGKTQLEHFGDADQLRLRRWHVSCSQPLRFGSRSFPHSFCRRGRHHPR
jgi:hypothetical protein